MGKLEFSQSGDIHVSIAPTILRRAVTMTIPISFFLVVRVLFAGDRPHKLGYGPFLENFTRWLYRSTQSNNIWIRDEFKIFAPKWDF